MKVIPAAIAASTTSLVLSGSSYEGSLLSGIPHDIYKEIDALQSTGTRTLLIIAGTPAGVNLLDPRQIEPALRTGYARAKVEAGKIQKFWA
jgi:NTE family protein